MARGMRLIYRVGWAIKDREPDAAAQIRAGVARLRNGAVQVPAANQRRAREALCRLDHGSPMWRFAVMVASGRVTREDLRILAEVVEAMADG